MNAHISLAIASSILPFVFGLSRNEKRSYRQDSRHGNFAGRSAVASGPRKSRKHHYSKFGIVNVVSNNRAVYLTGTVMTLDARQQAAKIAWSSPGVETVGNTLQVKK